MNEKQKKAKLVYDSRPRPGGQTAWTFAIVGANGEVQARSEPYDSKSNAKRGYEDLVKTIEGLAGGA